MFKYVPIAVVVTLIIGFSIFQGIWSDRWSDPAVAASVFIERLGSVPSSVGDWESLDTKSNLSAAEEKRQMEVAGALGNVSRTYTNKKTGKKVSLFLICGHARKVTGHTPDRCYPSAGFTSYGQQAKHSVDCEGTAAEFYTKIFKKQEPEGDRILQVFWTWSNGAAWQAPDSPVRTFGGVRALYKMYLVNAVKPGTGMKEALEASPCIDFCQEFVPQLNQMLFPDQTPTAGEADGDYLPTTEDTSSTRPHASPLQT